MIQTSDSYGLMNCTMVQRFEKKNIPFNSKIEGHNNCEIVVVTDNSIRRLKNLDERIINPKKMNLFSKRIDARTHVIYLIDKVYHDASWGGNIQYEDMRINGIQERIFIRASYSFIIEKGDKFISLLSETQNKYTQRYIVNKINSKIDNVIKSITSQNLNDNGFIKAQENIAKCAYEIQTKLSEEVLSLYGIKMSNLNLTLEEDEDHSTKRSEHEWNNLDKREEQSNV